MRRTGLSRPWKASDAARCTPSNGNLWRAPQPPTGFRSWTFVQVDTGSAVSRCCTEHGGFARRRCNPVALGGGDDEPAHGLDAQVGFNSGLSEVSWNRRIALRCAEARRQESDLVP